MNCLSDVGSSIERVPAVVEGLGGCFMLRHLLRGGAGFVFSSEDDGKSPEISMTDDLAEMLFSK